MQANSKDHAHKMAHNFKYGYAVNIDVEKGQDFGTFNVLTRVATRDGTGVFHAIQGSGFTKVVTYFTDEMVTDDPGDRLRHFTNVMDIVEGRKSNKALGVLVRQASLEDDEKALRNVLESFGRDGVSADKVNLATEIIQASKEGANLDMRDYL